MRGAQGEQETLGCLVLMLYSYYQSDRKYMGPWVPQYVLIEFLSFVFLPQRAPLARLRPLKAST